MKTKSKYYVYMAQCADGSIYTGISIDPERRIKHHNFGLGSKYIQGSRLPAKLVCVDLRAYSKGDALRIERKLKDLSRAEKLNFIKLCDCKYKTNLSS
jgi:putative endonuclease